MTERLPTDAAQLFVVTGLPGSGKQRFAAFLSEHLDLKEWRDDENNADDSGFFAIDRGIQPPFQAFEEPEGYSCRVLCVVDARSEPPRTEGQWVYQRLDSLLQSSDALVLAFADEVSLLDHNRWSLFIKHNYPDIKVLRWGRHGLDSMQFLSPPMNLQDKLQHWQAAQMQVLHFQLGKVVLDHLVMVLDNARRSLGMQIYRAKGVFHTLEYENLVALEAGVERIDTYAADNQDFDQSGLGKLCLQGIDLDSSWLESMLHACRV
ncbi:GTP-binding protein [Thiomicrorhabdus heinhorstiae]|uniref:GTP-binding protein n=1 Tax=Thiomicrorhabdus heinhorstiae TaxID=2748010 RepID=A0ABS0BXP9_9GAMM|nr:GTP-binding protein [Thiomicrorhabdus heinhorstiae]MBF6058573.1 GTP-binding protein [Thiomicrorhabdus heinhorstiae]